MTTTTFPSINPTHRRADIAVHMFGLAMVFGAGGLLISNAVQRLDGPLVWAVALYILCALASNLASCAYHFGPWHDKRVLLRRIDHAAIYPSITGTFTPFFVVADTNWTLMLLWLCWALTLVAIWNKITNPQVKSRWSTASYLALGALGLCAFARYGGCADCCAVVHLIGRVELCYRHRVLCPQDDAVPIRNLARVGEPRWDRDVCWYLAGLVPKLRIHRSFCHDRMVEDSVHEMNRPATPSSEQIHDAPTGLTNTKLPTKSTCPCASETCVSVGNVISIAANGPSSHPFCAEAKVRFRFCSGSAGLFE